MTRERLTSLLRIGILAVFVLGVAGYLIGSMASTSSDEAEAAREEGYDLAYGRALDKVQSITAKRGIRAGKVRGTRAGVESGAKEGEHLGKGFISIQAGAAEAEYANSARLSADAEAAERQANCGVLVTAPESCPTSGEIEAYRAAVAEARRAAEEKAKEDAESKPKPGKPNDEQD